MSLGRLFKISKCSITGAAAAAALSAAAFAILTPLPLAAAEASFTLPTLTPARNFVPQHFAQADAGGFWASGLIDGPQQPVGNAYGSASNVLVHFGNDNQPGVIRYTDSSVSAVVRAIDGGVFVADSHCSLTRYDGGGNLRWQQSALHVYSGGDDVSSPCEHLSADGEGGLWVQGGSNVHHALVRLAPNGVITVRKELAELGFSGLGEIQADPVSSNVYLGGKAGDQAMLSSLDGAGRERWRWRSGEAGTEVDYLKLAPNGQLEGAGTIVQGSLLQPLVFRTARDTAQVTVQHFDVPMRRLMGLAVTADGSGYLLGVTGTDQATSQLALYRLGDDGALGWNVNVAGCKGNPIWYCGSLQVASDGAALVLSKVLPEDAASIPVLVRYSAAGSPISRLPLASSAAYFLNEWEPLPQGDVIVADTAFSRFGATQKVAGPAPANFVPYDQPSLHTLLESDGGSFVLSQDSSIRRYTLIHYDAQGQVVWHQDTSGAWLSGDGPFDSPARYLPMRADAQKICIGSILDDASLGITAVECRHRSDGSLIFRTAISDPPISYSPVMQLLDEGRILVFQCQFEDDCSVTRLNATGAVEATTTLPLNGDSLTAVHTNRAGASVAFRSTNAGVATTLAGISANGAYTFQLPAEPGSRVVDAAIAEDGSAVFVTAQSATDSDHFFATRVDAAGRVLWKKFLLDQVEMFDSVPSLRLEGDSLYFAVSPQSDPSLGTSHAWVLRASLQTGEVRWTRSFAQAGDLAPLRLLPTRDGNLLATSAQSGRVQVRLLDGATGNLLNLHIEACGEKCRSGESALDTGDRLYLLTANFDAVHATQLQLARLDHVATAAAAPVPIEQQALGGAWWAPYSGGQGFMLDVLPASHTFFLPWFTYTTSGGNDPAALRWYTIQGSIPAAASSVELGIYDSTGGAFDAATPATAHRVGTATLAFTDCDNGALHYRFEGMNNGEKEGDISLTRLLPRTRSCKLPNGSVTPPPATLAPQGGFDTRMSGSWYEAANGGQGLQLEVQPGGIFFAPWFTYDPAGAADDPTGQHWMTLQGSIAEAKNGVATVAIAQALGGLFDGGSTHNQFVVGTAKLTAQACDRLRVDYRFDDSETAGSFRNKSGTLDLTKIGGCSP